MSQLLITHQCYQEEQSSTIAPSPCYKHTHTHIKSITRERERERGGEREREREREWKILKDIFIDTKMLYRHVVENSTCHSTVSNKVIRLQQ